MLTGIMPISLLWVLCAGNAPSFVLQKDLGKFDGYRVNSLDFSPDGKMLAVAYHKHVAVFSTETYKKLTEVELTDFSMSARFQSAGKLLGCGFKGGAGFYKTADWKLDHKLDTAGTPRLVFSHSGDWVALAYTSAEVRQPPVLLEVWETKKWKRRFSAEGHSSQLLALAISPDDKLIATGAIGGSVIVWDSETGKEKFSLMAPKKRAEALAFLPDSKSLLVSGYGDATLWDVTTRKMLFQTRYGSHCVAILSDSIVVFGGAVVDLSKKEADPWIGALKPVGNSEKMKLAWSKEAGLLASADLDGQVTLWRWDDGKKK